MENNIASYLLKDAIDLHVHAGPDIHDRKLDCIQLVEEAIAKKMRGLLIKDHNTITGDRAYILNKFFPQFKVYGAISCNPPVGGINPAAVEVAIRLGSCSVFMPTYSSKNHLSKWGVQSPLEHSPSSVNVGLSVLDENGKITDDVCEVLRLIAKHDVLLCTGHISSQEAIILLKEAREAKIKRSLVTHASLSLIGMSIEEQIEAVRLGALIEHSYVATSSYLPESKRTSIQEIANQIRQIGFEHCILSTDYGQKRNPSPVKGLELFVHEIILNGFSEKEINRMIKENPNILLRDDIC